MMIILGRCTLLNSVDDRTLTLNLAGHNPRLHAAILRKSIDWFFVKAIDTVGLHWLLTSPIVLPHEWHILVIMPLIVGNHEGLRVLTDWGNLINVMKYGSVDMHLQQISFKNCHPKGMSLFRQRHVCIIQAPAVPLMIRQDKITGILTNSGRTTIFIIVYSHGPANKEVLYRLRVPEIKRRAC